MMANDTLRVYDAYNLKVDVYSDRETVEHDEHTYYRYYGSSLDGKAGQDVSLAYHLNYKMFGKNCYGCDNDVDNLDLNTVYVNGNKYEQFIGESPGDFFVEIEPHTGIMTHRRKQVTVVFSLDCEKGSGSECASPVMPFPALENLEGASLPMFELTEDIKVDYDSL